MGFFVVERARVYLLNGTTGTLVLIQFWFLAAVTAIAPLAMTLWKFRVVRRLRRAKRSGLCPDCGYDLSGSPDRCPECGTITGGGALAATRVASDVLKSFFL